MKLLVVGAGATGGYYGAVAARGGADVTLVARGPHGQALREHGVRVRSSRGDFTVLPRVVGSLAELAGEQFDVVLVTVKAGDLAAIAPAAAAHVAPGGALVTAQNGVEAEEVAAPYVPADALVGAVLFVGVSVAEPGLIEHRSLGGIAVGAPRREGEAAARRTAEALASVGVEVRWVADLAAARWAKLVWNNAWNVVTALTRLTVAGAARQPPLRALATAAMHEVAALARARGVTLPGDIVERQLANADFVGEVVTSTLQDVLAGRPLEHDALCGVVVRLGRAAGVPTPVNDVLHPLLLGLDASLRSAR